MARPMWWTWKKSALLPWFVLLLLWRLRPWLPLWPLPLPWLLLLPLLPPLLRLPPLPLAPATP